jgi:probable rRNA maturation factor
VIEVEARAEVDVDLDAVVRRVRWTCERLGIERASVGLLIVGPQAMADVNGEHRGKPEPTDVLAFPIDGEGGPGALAAWSDAGPAPELGDIVICPDLAEEPLTTLAVHGLLHLLGHDHEVDGGEMLALQDQLVAEAEA